MRGKRIFSIVLFTVLTMFLLIIVASRASESRGFADLISDVVLAPAAPSPSEAPDWTPVPTPAPTPKPQDSKPEIDINSWEYILANADHNIGGYTPPETAKISGTEQYFDSRAVDALEAFLQGARDAGYTPYVLYAYRPYSTQQYLFNGRASQIAWPNTTVTEEDEEEAAKIVARPGESDYQTGLGVAITDRYYSSLDASVMDQGLLSWLSEHCAEYGFVVRYPASRASVTGRDEPWHFRYVGVEAAEFMTDFGLCLEEFREMYK